MIHVDMPSLEILDTPSSPLQEINQNRILDWNEERDHIFELFEKHKEKYRTKICVKCTDEQKIKRNCGVGKGLDSNGNILTYCTHMDKACTKKYQKQIMKHIDFHPLFFNPK